LQRDLNACATSKSSPPPHCTMLTAVRIAELLV